MLACTEWISLELIARVLIMTEIVLSLCTLSMWIDANWSFSSLCFRLAFNGSPDETIQNKSKCYGTNSWSTHTDESLRRPIQINSFDPFFSPNWIELNPIEIIHQSMPMTFSLSFSIIFIFIYLFFWFETGQREGCGAFHIGPLPRINMYHNNSSFFKFGQTKWTVLMRLLYRLPVNKPRRQRYHHLCSFLFCIYIYQPIAVAGLVLSCRVSSAIYTVFFIKIRHLCRSSISQQSSYFRL